MAGAVQVAEAAATQRIEPTQIEMGGSARLTIAASGNDASALSPPMVPGLEFVAVAQSQRIESINGVSNATTTVTYEVIPQESGVFTIPGRGNRRIARRAQSESERRSGRRCRARWVRATRRTLRTSEHPSRGLYTRDRKRYGVRSLAALQA